MNLFCVRCWVGSKPDDINVKLAKIVYRGDSLCLEHFNERQREPF